MSTTYHTNGEGNVGPCKATTARGCPFGGPEVHYSSPEAARSAYEERMDTSILPQGSLKLAELNAAAKTSTDPAVIEQVIARGSERTLRNFAKNPGATGEQLARAAERGDDETAFTLANHPAFPIAAMKPTHFARLLSDDRLSIYDRKGKRLLADPEVTDDHYRAVASIQGRDTGGRRDTNGMKRMMLQSSNKLSPELIAAQALSNTHLLGGALRGGRFPVGKLKHAPAIYWGDIDHSAPKYLPGFATWAAQAPTEDNRQYIASYLLRNPQVQEDTLEILGNAGMALDEVYAHSAATPELRARLEKRWPQELARTVKLTRLSQELGDLKQALTVSSGGGKVGRAAYSTEVQLDTALVKKHGLTREDIFQLFNARGYNMGVSYNEETGIFRGGVDSSD
jgi:hypothetical protein